MNKDLGRKAFPTTSARTLWFAAFLLWLPVLIPFACHYRIPPTLEAIQAKHVVPTGFIQFDQAYYMINAGAHFDKDGFHLFYGLPFSPHDDTPRIYFQPHVLVLGIFWKATHWDPATVYLLFGFLSGWVCLRVALGLFQALFGLECVSQWLVAVMWIWGGGVLTLLGLTRFALTRDLDDLFYFEPAGGMWFLNLGRNLIFPMEAYYHALFLGAIYQIICKRFWVSLLLILVLSMSHPFTGIELILILLSWAMLENGWIRSHENVASAEPLDPTDPVSANSAADSEPAIPTAWIIGLVVMAAAHLGYYFGFLRLFPEHRSLQEQWTQEWTYEIQHFGLAYALVAIFAFWSLRNLKIARKTLGASNNRLFLVWFSVAFALANHEFALKPAIQPMHFTRGYVWMPLFLLSGPALIQLTSWLLRFPVRRWIGASLLSVVFLMDNVLFLTTFHFRDTTLDPQIYIQESYKDVVELLNRPENHGALVVSPFMYLNYWLLLHCPVRAWYSHSFNTPHNTERLQEIKRFFEEGEFLPSWKDRMLIIILPSNFAPDGNPKLGAIFRTLNILPIHANADYHLYRYTP